MPGLGSPPYWRRGQSAPAGSQGATMKRHLAAPLAVAVALVLWGAPTADAAVAPNLTCGETIQQQSVTLNHDLVCPGMALLLEGSPTSSPNIPYTINLAGHSIATTGTGPSIEIINATVTLEYGRIAGFVRDDFAAFSTFQNLSFDGGGVHGDNDFPIIKNNVFINGANVTGSESDAEIEGNTFINGPSTATAMVLFESFSTVVNNTISGYGTGIEAVSAGSSVNIQGNHIAHVHGDGIVIGGFGADQVLGVVSNNNSSSNIGDGIVLADGSGVSSGSQPAGLLAANNVTNGNGYDGIHVDATKPAQNPQGLTVTIKGNHADSNGNLGIGAPRNSTVPPPVSVTDGGGNTAKHNANPAQCANVVCRAA
jgi:hypothetical protein